jgi:flagellar assembly factor FliW
MTAATAEGSATVSGSRAAAAGASGGGTGMSDDLPEITFTRPLSGFDGLTRFALVRLDGEDEATADGDGDDSNPPPPLLGDASAVLYELRSIEAPDVSFVVAVPAAFFPDYTVELDDSSCEHLGLDAQDDALVLVILTVGADVAHTTANLLAPVVINGRTREAFQVILSGSDWPVRAAVA